MERQRTCIGCGCVGDKRSFARIARTKDGSIAHDSSNKGNGRGAYVCSIECLRKSAETKRINRALRCDVPAKAIDLIEESLIASGSSARKDEE